MDCTVDDGSGRQECTWRSYVWDPNGVDPSVMRRGVGGAAKSGAGEGRGGLSDGPNLIPAPNVLEMPAWSGAEAAGRYPLEMMDRAPSGLRQDHHPDWPNNPSRIE